MANFDIYGVEDVERFASAKNLSRARSRLLAKQALAAQAQSREVAFEEEDDDAPKPPPPPKRLGDEHKEPVPTNAELRQRKSFIHVHT